MVWISDILISHKNHVPEINTLNDTLQNSDISNMDSRSTVSDGAH
jgi:hypothetical protein